MFLPCEIHLIAGIYKKTFGLVDREISGQIHFALAVNNGADFVAFGRALKRVTRQRKDSQGPDLKRMSD